MKSFLNNQVFWYSMFKGLHLIKKIYETKYKQLLVIPFAMLTIALVLIFSKFALTGEFINKGVSLKGGVTITISHDKIIDNSMLENFLSSELGIDVSVRNWGSGGKNLGVIVDAAIDTSTQEFALEKTSELISLLKSQLGDFTEDYYSVETMGSSLSQSFFRETFRAIILAFIFMGLVVFLYFRTFIPSIAVILAAFSDMVVTLAIVNLLGLELSTAGIAAFLMLIGYSVDTDILLTTKLLKRKGGDVSEKVYNAMKTGLMMSVTTIIAISTALFFTQSFVLKQIMIILLIGLFVDLINTWIQNVGILRWYLDNKSKKWVG